MEVEIVPPTSIVKRDGRIVPFDVERIENALTRCFAGFDATPATSVCGACAARRQHHRRQVERRRRRPSRTSRTSSRWSCRPPASSRRPSATSSTAPSTPAQREERPIPDEVRAAFAGLGPVLPDRRSRSSSSSTSTPASTTSSAAARPGSRPSTGPIDFLHELAGDRLPAETYQRIRHGILEMRAMPSMRLLAMAGPAARRNNITIYNCSYQPVESIDSFCEALIISMSGCGVGYSVESKYVENFPRIKRQTGASADLFVVEDSAEGWADALRFGLERWFEGGDVRFDLSLIRAAGAPAAHQGRPRLRPGAAPADARLHAAADLRPPGLVPAPDRRPRHDVRGRHRRPSRAASGGPR